MAGLISTTYESQPYPPASTSGADFPDYQAEQMAETFKPSDLIAGVFTTEEERTAFIGALTTIKEYGGSIKVGGRTLREAMGCTTIDYTKGISSEQYTEEQKKLLGPLVEMLQQYPEERMLRQDLDLYFEGMNLETIRDILEENRICAEIKTATGDVKILVVKGSGGEATFIHNSDSWQVTTEAVWPKMSIKADFEINPEPQFRLNSNYGSLFLYPLFSTISEMSGPIEPKRFSTISRILLWFLTVKDPDGNWLKPPDIHTQNLITQSVFHGYKRFRELSNPEDPSSINYRGSLRDFALAMRILLLTDWEMMEREGYPAENIAFIKNLLRSWTPAILAKNKSARPTYIKVSERIH